MKTSPTSSRVTRFFCTCLGILTILLLVASPPGDRAAEPGLPFTEDFATTDLRDDDATSADWSTDEQALLLARERKLVGWGTPRNPNDITSDAQNTTAIELVDANGDGFLDLIAGNFGHTTRFYPGEGGSTPWQPSGSGEDITSATHSTYDLALGDLDADGDLDLVEVGDGFRPRLYLNDGDDHPWSELSAGLELTTDSLPANCGILGDVDGDSDLDLLVGVYNSTNRLYLNQCADTGACDGSTNPWAGATGTAITPDADKTFSMALGDLDLDGDLDLVAANGSSETVRAYLSNGTADPWGGVSGMDVSSDTWRAVSVALGDVDGDGDLDAVVGHSDHQNRLYRNDCVERGGCDGSENPWDGVAGVDITTDSNSTTALTLGDIEGDGDLDVLTANDTNVNYLYLNTGTTDPWGGAAGVPLSSDTYQTSEIALGDLNADGDLDVVMGHSGQANQYLWNNGTGDPWGAATGADITTHSHFTHHLALGDVDGDGDPDLVVGNNGETNYLYLNDGSDDPWGSATGSTISADAHFTEYVLLQDVNGDGSTDLIALNGQHHPNRLYLSNGTADPWNGVAGSDLSGDTFASFSGALGDLNADGHLDLVTGNNNDPNRLYLNNGSADPWNGVTGSNVTADSQGTLAVALGDMNNDGHLDLVVGNSAQATRLYLHNGTADPWNGVAGSDISTDTDPSREVALGDVNRDGHLDVVVVNANMRADRLYVNNGTSAPFSGVGGVDVGTDVIDTKYVELHDIDRDGNLDVVVGAYETNRIYLGDGSSDPWYDEAAISITGDIAESLVVRLADADGDGDVDVVAGNNGDRNRLYTNNRGAEPWNGVTAGDITADASNTMAVALGDVDGDGKLDLVAANRGFGGETDRLYLNNGTSDPWDGVTGSDITTDAYVARAAALGDVNSDGHLDLVVGNEVQYDRLYLNNGTADPFSGVTSSPVGSGGTNTNHLVLGDVNGDGHLDIVTALWQDPNELFLNNGTATPFSGVTGSDITADDHQTQSVRLGDVNRDGSLDLVVGNWQGTNRLYLNNGTADPFNGVTGSNLPGGSTPNHQLWLGDVDGDGDLDLILPNDGYRNWCFPGDGSNDPWGATTGLEITDDAHATEMGILVDVDVDGDPDFVAANKSQPNRLYLNNGTTDPWSGVVGIDVGTDTHDTRYLAAGDVDGDGIVDLVAGNAVQVNRFYTRVAYYDTGRGRATSQEVDGQDDPILYAALTPTATSPAHTSVEYWMTNDSGWLWVRAEPGDYVRFPSLDNRLHWRARLGSLSPAVSLRIDSLTIDVLAPSAGDRVWEDWDADGIQDDGEPGLASVVVALYDDVGGLMDIAVTDGDGKFSHAGVGWNTDYQLRFFEPPGWVFAPQDAGGDDLADSDADPANGYTAIFTVDHPDDLESWDAGMAPDCEPPDESVYIYDMGLTGEGYAVLHFMDWNQPVQLTGFNVYRSDDPGLPPEQWTLEGSNITDGDEGTPNYQWVDDSGDPGTWYYKVTPYNDRCPPGVAEGPWGPPTVPPPGLE